MKAVRSVPNPASDGAVAIQPSLSLRGDHVSTALAVSYRMVFDLHLSPSDWTAFQQALVQRARARAGRGRVAVAVFIATAIAMAALALLQERLGDGTTAFVGFAAGMFTIICVSQWSSGLLRRQLSPDADGAVLGHLRMELSPEGIRTVRRASVGLTQWSALQGITRTDTHLFLWLDRVAAHIVPLRDVPQGPDALLDAIREFAGPLPCVSVSDERPSAAPGGQEAPTTPGFLPTLARRLTWRRVAADSPMGSSDAMILACASTALAVWLGCDRYAAGRGAVWYLGGMTGLAWYATGVLALAWVLHRASQGGAPFRPLLATIVASLPLLVALGVAIRLGAPERIRPVGYLLLAVAGLSYLKRGLTLAGARLRGALLAGTLFASLFAVATRAAWVYPHLWYTARNEGHGRRPSAETERLLFGQADRIDAAAARMTPGREHEPNVFFVGFAGDAEQKVFAEELKLAERVVTDRYGASGRSLLLINDERDHDRWPIATVEGLRRALARVGARMNREEDVLFLMLTSHGSDEPTLVVSNGDWPLEQLDGHDLRAALDESGVRWRVVVISACHSGAFIEPLADEGTIVLTAAAKERTSFGCDDAADLTYFGQAFLRDALPRAESLEDAFERAKEIIADRERREKLQASEPQAYYGSAMRAHWKQVEASRARGSSTKTAGAPEVARPSVLDR